MSYEKLIADAAKAQEMFGDDELEKFAASRWQPNDHRMPVKAEPERYILVQKTNKNMAFGYFAGYAVLPMEIYVFEDKNLAGEVAREVEVKRPGLVPMQIKDNELIMSKDFGGIFVSNNLIEEYLTWLKELGI